MQKVTYYTPKGNLLCYHTQATVFLVRNSDYNTASSLQEQHYQRLPQNIYAPDRPGTPQRYKSNHNENDKALRALHIHVFPPQASRNQVYIFYACQTNVKLYLFPTKSR